MTNSEARKRICPFAMPSEDHRDRNCVGDDCMAWEREPTGDEEGFCRAFPTFLKYNIE